MKTPSSFIMPALLVAALLLPVTGVWAQAADETVPVPLPLSPENTRFEFDAVTEHPERQASCKLTINDQFKDAVNSGDNSKRLYATNNPDDPCRNNGPTTNNDGSKGAISKTSGTFDFPISPVFNNTTFQTDVDVEGQLHIWADGASYVLPKVQLVVGDFSTNWTAPAERTHSDGGKGWHVFNYNLGKLPEILTGKAVVKIHTVASADPDNPRAPTLAVYQYGVGIVEDHQSYIDLPLAEQPVEEEEPTTFVCQDPDGENVTFEVNETQSSCDDIVFETPDNGTTDDNTTTDGNETADGNATEDADADANATGNSTDELGGSERGIPGFETVVVAGAIGLLALAGHQRRRGPRPTS